MPIFQSPAGQITVPRHINAGTLITLTPGAGATVTLEYTLADMPAIINRTADWQVWSKGAATAPLQDMIMQAMYVRTTSIGGAGSTYTTDPFPTAEQMRAYRATFGGTTQAAQAVITGGKSVGSIATASPANGYSFTAGQWYADGVAIGDRVVVSGTPDAAARGVTILKTCTIPGAIGDAYEAWCQFDLAAGSAFIRAINISMSGVGQTPNRGVDKIMSALPRSGVLRCPPYILTTNAASIQVSFGCQFGLGATAADFTISKPVLRKVTGANALNP